MAVAAVPVAIGLISAGLSDNGSVLVDSMASRGGVRD